MVRTVLTTDEGADSLSVSCCITCIAAPATLSAYLVIWARTVQGLWLARFCDPDQVIDLQRVGYDAAHIYFVFGSSFFM
jgi:hypothetical protein